jgi:hypothetical protein
MVSEKDVNNQTGGGSTFWRREKVIQKLNATITKIVMVAFSYSFMGILKARFP